VDDISKDESNMDFSKTCLLLKKIVNFFFVTMLESHNKHLLFSCGLVLYSTSNYSQIKLQIWGHQNIQCSIFKDFSWESFLHEPNKHKVHSTTCAIIIIIIIKTIPFNPSFNYFSTWIFTRWRYNVHV
jgi:hypothetical protein